MLKNEYQESIIGKIFIFKRMTNNHSLPQLELLLLFVLFTPLFNLDYKNS